MRNCQSKGEKWGYSQILPSILIVTKPWIGTCQYHILTNLLIIIRNVPQNPHTTNFNFVFWHPPTKGQPEEEANTVESRGDRWKLSGPLRTLLTPGSSAPDTHPSSQLPRIDWVGWDWATCSQSHLDTQSYLKIPNGKWLWIREAGKKIIPP